LYFGDDHPGAAKSDRRYMRAWYKANNFQTQEDRIKECADEDSDDYFWSDSEEDLEEDSE
jgi:hypothetical protein